MSDPEFRSISQEAIVPPVAGALGERTVAAIVGEQSSDSRLPPLEQLPEWDVLTSDQIQATPAAEASGGTNVEAMRTGLSVACVLDAYHDRSERFPGLTPEEGHQLHLQVREAMPTAETLDAFLLLLLTHDFGKNDDIRRAVQAGADIDHDEVYTRLVTDPARTHARQRYMPSFDLLSPSGQRLLVGVASLRTNYPQSLQGEAPAATLEDFHNESDQHIKMLDILKAKFDIFGAAGHVDPNVSLTATSATIRRMNNLDASLLRNDLATPEDRNNAFLDAELAYFLRGAEPEDDDQRTALRALARLECALRITDHDAFDALHHTFTTLPAVSKTVLTHELNRSSRTTLAYYSPVLLNVLSAREGQAFALEYFAHILQEAHIADQKARRDGLTGIAVVHVEDLVQGIKAEAYNPRSTSVRFIPKEGALIAEPQEPTIRDIEGLPEFAGGERLRGKRVLFVGEGGGSDGIQAAMLSRLFADKYGCETAAVVSTRNSERTMTGTEEHLGHAIKRITPNTAAVGDWRFLENIPLEDDPVTPVYILNSTDEQVVAHDVEALIAHTGADTVIGVDTGGDSLFRGEHPSFSAHLPSDITPDNDYNVIKGLATVSARNPQVNVLSAIVAPGVDSPKYGREMLDTIQAQSVPLTAKDTAVIQRTYAGWRMDGRGSEEGRYGKTPFAWLHALAGRIGLQHLDLPKAMVTSVTNPWRAYMVVTPAMAAIVIADMEKHFSAIRRTHQ